MRRVSSYQLFRQSVVCLDASPSGRAQSEMPASCERGSILIASLWLLMIFVLLVVSLGYRNGLESKVALREKEYFLSEQLLQSGINLFQYILERDKEPTVDSKHDEWYNPNSILSDLWESANISLEVQDAESKMNINAASDKQLELLFEAIEESGIPLYSDSEDLVLQIIEWRGGETAKKEKRSFGEVKGSRFVSLYELFFLEDFDARDFDTLRDYLTVYGNEKLVSINPNTVLLPVLKGVVFSLAGDERTKKKLYEALVDFRQAHDSTEVSDTDDLKTDEALYFRDDELSPYQLLETLSISSDVLSVSLALQFVRQCTLDSRYFELTISVVPGSEAFERTAEIMIGPRLVSEGGVTSENGYMVYAWHELN